VIGLGILIVLGTALVIGVVVKRLIAPGPAAAPAAAAVSAAPAAGAAAGPARPFSVVLPGGAGAQVTGLAAADGLVAVLLRNGQGSEIVFIDPRNGRVAGTAATAH
jgi:hypothetical protein